MTKTTKTAVPSHENYVIPEHPHRGPGTEIKLGEGDCAVVFRKGGCPEFILNVQDGSVEMVDNSNYLLSPYFMTNLIYAVYHGHPAMLMAMNMMAKLHAQTDPLSEIIDKPDESGLDNPVVFVN